MIKLGDKVTAPRRLWRRTRQDGKIWRKEWHTISWETTPIVGIYTGYRNYRNGVIFWDHDGGHIFVGDETIKIALIVKNERSKPVPVLFSEMEKCHDK